MISLAITLEGTLDEFDPEWFTIKFANALNIDSGLVHIVRMGASIRLVVNIIGLAHVIANQVFAQLRNLSKETLSVALNTTVLAMDDPVLSHETFPPPPLPPPAGHLPVPPPPLDDTGGNLTRSGGAINGSLALVLVAATCATALLLLLAAALNTRHLCRNSCTKAMQIEPESNIVLGVRLTDLQIASEFERDHLNTMLQAARNTSEHLNIDYAPNTDEGQRWRYHRSNIERGVVRQLQFQPLPAHETERSAQSNVASSVNSQELEATYTDEPSVHVISEWTKERLDRARARRRLTMERIARARSQRLPGGSGGSERLPLSSHPSCSFHPQLEGSRRRILQRAPMESQDSDSVSETNSVHNSEDMAMSPPPTPSAIQISTCRLPNMIPMFDEIATWPPLVSPPSGPRPTLPGAAADSRAVTSMLMPPPTSPMQLQTPNSTPLPRHILGQSERSSSTDTISSVDTPSNDDPATSHPRAAQIKTSTLMEGTPPAFSRQRLSSASNSRTQITWLRQQEDYANSDDEEVGAEMGAQTQPDERRRAVYASIYRL